MSILRCLSRTRTDDGKLSVVDMLDMISGCWAIRFRFTVLTLLKFIITLIKCNISAVSIQCEFLSEMVKSREITWFV